MKSSFDKSLEILQIGEKILITNNIAKLGTKPGFLDKMFGEEDLRRMTNIKHIVKKLIINLEKVLRMNKVLLIKMLLIMLWKKLMRNIMFF